MTPTSRPARTAAQLAQLLDQDPAHPTQALAARLVTTAHLLWTAGHLATTRAAEHAPGIRAANTDPHRTHGGGDPTATAAERNLAHGPDDTATLDRDLRRTIADLDQATTRLANLIDAATATHRHNNRPTTECAEALCTEAATPGRLGYCETDYRRRLRWAETHGQPVRDWHPEAGDTPLALTKAERLGIHQAPALTHEQLADRAIRKRRKTA